jgi:hypothetical protein
MSFDDSDDKEDQVDVTEDLGDDGDEDEGEEGDELRMAGSRRPRRAACPSSAARSVAVAAARGHGPRRSR